LKDIPGYSGLYSVSQDGLIHYAQHAKDAGVLCGGGRNRFNSEQVDEMRKEYFSGLSLKEVSKQFNCGEATVWRAVHKVGRNTKHLHFELKD